MLNECQFLKEYTLFISLFISFRLRAKANIFPKVNFKSILRKSYFLTLEYTRSWVLIWFELSSVLVKPVDGALSYIVIWGDQQKSYFLQNSLY